MICESDKIAERYPDELGASEPSLDYDFSPHTRRTFRIVECNDCSHQFVDPMPNLENSYHDVVDPKYLASRPQRIRTSRQLIKRLSSLGASGKLLDIGCNAGFFLDEACKTFEVEGLELSSWASEIAARRHIVHNVPLQHLHGERCFDVVSLLGVIEHLPDPVRELVEIERLIKRNGLIVIFTGTRDSILPRLLGKKWWWYQGMHLQYFTNRSLELLLARFNFEVVASLTHTTWFSLESLHQSARRYRLARWALCPLLAPWLRSLIIPIRLSGERLIIARKSG